MKNWIARGDAARDGVHFSASGYTKFGDMLANDILALAGKSASGGVVASSHVDTHSSRSAVFSVNTQDRAMAHASICNVDEANDCKIIH